MKVTVGIADDHQLFVKSLSLLVNSFADFEVMVEALNGKELLDKLASSNLQPDILLIDSNMPVMDGTETVEAITRQYPSIKITVLSMEENDPATIRMLRAGCCEYLLKDIHPDELEAALVDINNHGYYNPNKSGTNLWKMIRKAFGKKEHADTDGE